MSDVEQHVGYQDTSLTALKESEEGAPELRWRILKLLELCGTYGATDEEIEVEFRLATSRSGRPARTELRDSGLVRDSGARRKTASGGTAIVWELTPPHEVEAQLETMAPSILKKRIKKELSSLGMLDLLRVYEYSKTLKRRKKTMNAQEARWFLAHAKGDDDVVIDEWVVGLTQNLGSPGWAVTVTPGRDDYETRARVIGGWKVWCKDVPHGLRYDNQPLFHGVIVPIHSTVDRPTVGKATATIIDGFVREGKYAFAWCPDTATFRQIVSLSENEEDDWKSYATLILTAA